VVISEFVLSSYLENTIRRNIEILGRILCTVGQVQIHLVPPLAHVKDAFHSINILVLPLDSVAAIVILATMAGLAMGYAYRETKAYWQQLLSIILYLEIR
jgi:hypothetical protein